MNGLARVGISLLLLGACAVAMRFTMVKIVIPEAQYGQFSTQAVFSGKQLIKLTIQAEDLQNEIHISSGENYLMRATYKASQASRISLSNGIGGYKYLYAGKKEGQHPNYFFLASSPKIRGISTVQLPTQVPLELKIDTQKISSQRLRIDLRNLRIKRVIIGEFSDSKKRMIELYLPKGDLDTEINVNNKNGSMLVFVERGTRGKLNIQSTSGDVSVLTRQNPHDIGFNIKGQANDKTAFDRRLSLNGLFDNVPTVSSIPKNFEKGMVMMMPTENKKNLSQDDVIAINVDLGQQGTFLIGEWTGL